MARTRISRKAPRLPRAPWSSMAAIPMIARSRKTPRPGLTARKPERRTWPAAALCLLLAGPLNGCTQPPPSPVYVLTPQAVPRAQVDGLPHLDTDGRTITRFAPQRSFLALALGGVLEIGRASCRERVRQYV